MELNEKLKVFVVDTGDVLSINGLQGQDWE